MYLFFSYHERAGDKFVAPCLKMWYGLLSTLSHLYPIRLDLMGYMDDLGRISGQITFSNGVEYCIVYKLM